MKRLLLLALIFISAIKIIYAQSAETDSSFGYHGIVKTDLGVNYNYGEINGCNRFIIA